MKIYLDDVRDIPDGYIGCRTAKDAINLLKTGKVTYISFDHDLGSCVTGYDVANYIENMVHDGHIPLPDWNIHSSNPIGSYRINQAMESASHIAWLRSNEDIQ